MSEAEKPKNEAYYIAGYYTPTNDPSKDIGGGYQHVGKRQLETQPPEWEAAYAEATSHAPKDWNRIIIVERLPQNFGSVKFAALYPDGRIYRPDA